MGLGSSGSQTWNVPDSFVTKPLMDLPIFCRGANHPAWKTPMNKSAACLQQICSCYCYEFYRFSFIFGHANLMLMISEHTNSFIHFLFFFYNIAVLLSHITTSSEFCILKNRDLWRTSAVMLSPVSHKSLIVPSL